MIFVVGSLNMDSSVSLVKFPRAGETVAAKSVLVSCGGKGANQAAAVGKLGGKCAMIGKVGRDEYGARMKENLRSLGVDTRFVTEADCVSGTAQIWICGGNNRIVTDGGANMKLTPADIDEGLSGAKSGDVLIVQLEVPHEAVSHALKTGRRKGMITILNPAPATALTAADYENADIVMPNETETEILTGVVPDCEVNLALAAKKFKDMGARNIVVTLGKKGSAVIVGNNITLVPARKVKAVDTTGAGDTFVGAAALKLEAGEDLVTAAEFATFASAITVTRRGATAAIPTIEEVREAVESGKI